MSMTVGELVAKGKVDTREFDRGLDRMEDELERSGSRMGRILDKFKRDSSRTMSAAGSDAGKKFADGLTRDANGRLRDSKGRFAKAGTEAATGFVTNSIKALMGQASAITKLITNPYVAAIGAAAAAAGAIGGLSLAGGVALAGLGLGFIGLGAMAVKGSKQVQEAAGDLADEATRTLTRAGAVMEKPIVGALARIQKSVRDVRPELTEMFEDAAPHVDDVADGVGGLIDKLVGGGGLNRAVEASGSVLDKLGAKLPDTGDAFDDLFDGIAEGAEGSGDALVAFLSLVNFQVRAIGNIVGGAGKAYDFLTSKVGVLTGGVLNSLAAKMGEVDTETGETADTTADLSDDMQELTDNANKLTDTMRKLADGMSKSTLSMAAASTNASESQRRLADSIKDVGNSFRLGTPAGDRNRSMLESVARNAFDVRDAMVEMSLKAGDGQAEAWRKGDRAMMSQIVSLRGTLKAAKLTDAQIDELLRSVGLIPAGKKTAVSAPGAVGAKNAMDKARLAANSIPPRKHTVISASASVNAAERALNYAARPRIAPITAVSSANAAEYRAAGGLAGSGPLRRFANGGFNGVVSGPGTKTSDSILARLSRGEFVVRASTVDKLGVGVMNYINSTGRLPMASRAMGSPNSGLGWSDQTVLVKLAAIERAIAGLQLQVSIGDETIARANRRGEKLLTYRG